MLCGMGRADGAVIATITFQGMAAARVIIEAAGGSCTFGGWQFNEYLEQGIDDHLLVAAPDGLFRFRNSLKPIS